MAERDFENISIGLNYPIRRSGDGYFDKTYTSIDQVKANLINLLATRRGERIMNPEFGSNLERIIFEQSTRDIEEAITSEIENTVGRWMPQVDITNINIERRNDENAVLVDVTFDTVFLPNNKEENLELWFSFNEQ